MSPPVSRLLALMAAGLVALAIAAGPAAARSPVVLSQGHVDAVDVAYEDGRLAVHVHDESVEPDVERDPADVLFRVKAQARSAVPADPAYRFLGAPGAPVWILPETQDPALLWLGLATEELEPGVLRGDAIQLRLRRVTGPDGFSVFAVDPFGAPQVLLDSENGLPDTLALPVGSHRHANWAFERPGSYCLVVEAVGRLAGTGRAISSGPVTLRFQVQR